MNRILVITDEESDLSKILTEQYGAKVIKTDAKSFDPNAYDALCILAGNSRDHLTLPAHLRARAEEMVEQKKTVFCEYVSSFLGVYYRSAMTATHHRMVYSTTSFAVNGFEDGDILDGHGNNCLKYNYYPEGSEFILNYHDYLCAHTNIKLSEEEAKAGVPALWLLNEKTLISSIRLCNFRRARLSPMKKWEALISAIVGFITGESASVAFAPPVCEYKKCLVHSATDTDAAVAEGLDWVKGSEILIDGGEGGMLEGFANLIYAKDGVQKRSVRVRADCIGEIGGAFLFDALLNGNAESKETADKLFKFIFDWMQVKSGEHKGMIRWTTVAWELCFQDDVARAILALLLSQHINGEVPYLENIKMALDYILLTTCEDGIRTQNTEIRSLTPEEVKRLLNEAESDPCAHFNAYYHAVLLLAYKATGEERYLKVGCRGLETLMSKYPETRRETSETEESCRLVFPLAVLYGITGSPEHYGWLCRVVDDLEARRHPSGGYAEWDTGYKAFCAHNHKGECALVAENGDPIADMLYSNNWLPLGFSYAYYVTGEKKFYDLWTSCASFMLSTQMKSADPKLNGAWARAMDMDSFENYAMPHDVGWGPCCIESGWTVGEILMGLQFMHIAEKKHK